MSARNAEPETVALAVLDACERAARGCSPDYDDVTDADAQFMKRSVDSIQSRVRTLKRQAAALWKPEFASMLDQCHSIAVEHVDYPEKEGVRTEKMKCMACGRFEHCCKFALSGVGHFKSDDFNLQTVGCMEDNWTDFYTEYTRLCDEDFVDYTRRNKLPLEDMGEYTIGATCLRKAELYYLTNTLLMECCYEANYAAEQASSGTKKDDGKWFYATDKQAAAFLKKLEEIELAIADEKRPLPSFGTDAVLWDKVDKARDKASGNDAEERLELLRKRAAQMLARAESGSEDGQGSEEEESDVAVVSEHDDEKEDDCPKPSYSKRRPQRHRARAILDSDDDEGDEPATCEDLTPAARQSKRKMARREAAEPTRRSRRVQRLSPEIAMEGPREEGMDEDDVETHEAAEAAEADAMESGEPGRGRGREYMIRTGSRAALPNAFNMAQEQRTPGGRLPARRRCLFNLGALQLRLLNEGRDDDSAICTNAMFTIQELLARCDMLAHTVE